MTELTTKSVLIAIALVIGGLMLSFRVQLMTGRLQIAADMLHRVTEREAGR